MGLQVPYHLDSEIPEKIVIWATPKTSWGGFQRTIYAKGEQSHRRSPHVRPCSYAAVDSTQICGGTGSWFYQGQKCHQYSEDLFWTQEELYEPEFLGQRVLCLHRWQRREGRSRIHKKTRRRGPKARSVKVV